MSRKGVFTKLRKNKYNMSKPQEELYKNGKITFFLFFKLIDQLIYIIFFRLLLF